MQDRYALRFESGERRGERIPIVASGLSVGRRTGSSLQILDPSVSGRHAEVTIDEQGPLLRDLGSTNGTRVRGERVLETRLAHGDAVLFGNVELRFEDAELAGAGLAGAGARPAARAGGSDATAGPGSAGPGSAPPGDTLGRVSAERVLRSKRRSLVGVVAIVLLAAAGGAAWFLLGREGGARAAHRPVTDVAGNLVDDASFEASGSTGWGADADADAAFMATPGARWSGDLGLEADLAPGEWALVRSRAARVAAGRTLIATARLRVSGGATALLGVEFSDEPVEVAVAAQDDAEGGARAAALPSGVTTGWADELADDGSGWREVRVAVPAPPGSTRASLVVRALAGADEGRVALDDAALVQEPGSAEPAAAVAEDRLYALGEPAREALLHRVDARLLSGLRVVERDGDGAARILALGVEPGPIGVRFAFAARADAALELVVEPDLLASGLGTLAQDGFRSHGLTFERAEVESLLLGSGRDVVALRFERSSAVRATARGAASAVSVRLGDARSFDLQLDFREEHKAAEVVAHEARKAQQSGDLGGALERWAELLDRYPYERSLVDEAEAERSRLIKDGLAELRTVENEVERARFFQLADLFQRCRERALAVGARYAASEVEEAAASVVAAADQELERLAGDGPPREVAELEAILSVLEAREATGLAAELRGYIDERRAAAPGRTEDGADDDGRGGASKR